MRVEHCTYKNCGKVIEPAIDNRCEDDDGNPFCSEWHRDSYRHRMQQEHSIVARIGRVAIIWVLLVVAVLVLLAVLSGG